MTDPLDDLVRAAAPTALGEADETRELALALAVAAAQPANRRRRRTGRLAITVMLGLGLLGAGVGAAAAVPAIAGWLDWAPDAVAERSFEFGEGTPLGRCEVLVRVQPVYGALPDSEVDGRLEQARRFLADENWDDELASITEREVRAALQQDQAKRDQLAAEDPSVTPPPATLSLAATRIMYARFAAEFEQAGFFDDGSVSLEAAAGPCDGARGGARDDASDADDER
ncbi:hypothetical protein FLP10_09090 [Agromyces intestinalis]|uniref:Uncharacterized protein n=1 Tax=Agromyces intestinalis TaxID=2592652 RepID=A0A5C1YHP3_9MICO|nr:hypothetical protein [Agromyces intestinalis]QEO14557.1 hypothetical protein FLP10_09090 [Agromyces intestinalis]